MPVLVTEKFDTYSICLWDIQEDEPFFRQQLNFTPSASHAAIALQQWGARMALKTLEPDFPFNFHFRIVQVLGRRPYQKRTP
jgi:hypothetical protein